MKKKNVLWFCVVLMTVFGMSSCSSDEEDTVTNNGGPVTNNEKVVIDPDGIVDYQFSEAVHTDSVDGCTITRDETGRIARLDFYKEGVDPIEKLSSCPSSFDDIKHLFPLSEGHEIRLEGTSHLETITGEKLPQCSEIYCLYYKGVLVDYGYGRFHAYYLDMPEGKWLTWADTKSLIDVSDVNTIPAISEQQAKQVFADYQKVDRDDSWDCKLRIREYSTRKDDAVVRKHILVYDVTGPYPPEAGPCATGWSRPNAVIDAHTGHIIATNR